MKTETSDLRSAELAGHEPVDAALRQSQERYQLVARATNDVIWDWNMITGEVVWNEALRPVFGYAEEEIGSNITEAYPWWRDRIHPADRENVTASLDAAIARGGEFWSGEYRFRRADGSYAMVLDRGYIARNEQGEPVRMVGAMLDITERKRAEDALRHSEERFRALIEHSADAITLHAADGRLRYVSPAASRILGYADEDLIHANPFDFIHPDELEHAQSLLSEIFQNPGKPVTGQYRARHKDGSWRWVETTVTNMLDNPSVGAIVGNYHDITERKQAETARQDIMRALLELIDAAPLAIIVLDRDGNVKIWNPAAEQIFGWRLSEVLSRPLPIVPEDKRDEFGRLLELAQQGVEVSDLQTQRRKRGGELIDVSLAMAPLRDAQGDVVGSMRIIADITERRRAEQALQETTQVLRALIQASPLAIMALDPDGNVKMWNPAAELIFGWREHEVLGRPLPNIPEDKQSESRIFLEFARQGVTFGNVETQRQKKDGSLIDISVSVAPLRDAQGDIQGSMSIMADITERKQAEEALRVSQERLQHVMASSPAVIYVLAVEGDTLRLTWVSENITQMLGYTAQEALAPDWWVDHLHPDDQAQVLRDQALPSTHDHLVREFRFQHRDGTYRWIRDEWSLLRDAAGQPVEVIGSWADITERKQAEMALRESEERFAAFMNNTSIQTWMKDEDLRYVYCNEPFERLVGRPRDMIIGNDDFELWPQHTADELRANDGNVLTSGALLETHETVPNAEGQIRYSQVFKFPFRDADGKQYVGGMAVDITERNRAEVALRESHERLHSLSRQLLGVQEAERRHIARELHDEIGQSLTGLKLLLAMGARLPSDAARVKMNESLTLVDTLMDKVHGLSLDLRPTMLDDLGLLPALLSHFERYTAQAGVCVTFEHNGLNRRFAPEVETAAYRIVQEALTNVARHAQVSQAAVRVWVDQSGLYVQIEDQGPGFDAEAVLAAHASSGLAGMRERAVLLGGELSVMSAPGTGTQVLAELPVHPIHSDGESRPG